MPKVILTLGEIIQVQRGIKNLSEKSSSTEAKQVLDNDTLFNEITYPTTRFLSKTKSIIEEHNDLRKSTLKQMGEEIFAEVGKDKKNKPLYEPTGRFSLGENKDDFDAKMKKVEDEEHIIEGGGIRKFKMSTLRKLGADVDTIVSLEPLIEDDLDTVEETEK